MGEATRRELSKSSTTNSQSVHRVMHNELCIRLSEHPFLKQRTLRCFHRRVPLRSSNQQLLRIRGTKCGAEESCKRGPEVALEDAQRLKTFAPAVNRRGLVFQKEALSRTFESLNPSLFINLLAKRALTPFWPEKPAFHPITRHLNSLSN